MNRRIGIVMTICMLFISVFACAQAMSPGDLVRVTRCEEYITLREYPNRKAGALSRLPLGQTVLYAGEVDGDFLEVVSHGVTGWALAEYLEPIEAEAGEPFAPDSAMTINLNLYLTTFSRQDFAEGNGQGYWADDAADAQLTDFAVDYLWFAEPGAIESGEWGEDNARVAAWRVPDIAERFLGKRPADEKATRFRYQNGYYYWQETGGHMQGGFAILRDAEQLADDRLRVTFALYGASEGWTPEGVCMFSERQALLAYPDSGTSDGMAIIDTHDSENREDWTLQRWAVWQNP